MGGLTIGIFLVVGLLEVCSEWLKAQYLVFALKPMIMVQVALLVWQRSQKKKVPVPLVLLIGMLFAWLGDIFLLFESDIYFILGLLSFLVMQLVYSFCFRTQLPVESMLFVRATYFVLFVSTNWLIREGVKDLAIPVGFYSAVLCIMGVSAAEAANSLTSHCLALYKYKDVLNLQKAGDISEDVKKKLKTCSAIITNGDRLILGSVLFIVSDLTIAITKFGVLNHSSGYQAFIMATYIFSQYLIGSSFVDAIATIREAKEHFE
jgi:uncharacterized membrane protein YhhN